MATLTLAARAFADACYANALHELRSALRSRSADRTDCAEWGITPSQWRLAIQTALAEREPATLAAQALRAIPSEARSETSRRNGARGGRPRSPAYARTCRRCAARPGDVCVGPLGGTLRTPHADR